MSAHSLQQSAELSVAASSARAFCQSPSAQLRLIPPWLALEPTAVRATDAGCELALGLPYGPLRVPLAISQSCLESAAGATLVERVSWRSPLGALSARALQRRVERLLSYRQQLTRADLERLASVDGGGRRRVLISGASGLIGRQLVLLLEAAGHEVVRLVRRASSGPGELGWQPVSGEIEQDKLSGFYAVLHLAGESVARRWSPEQKMRIEQSRVLGTRTLCQALSKLPAPPPVLVSASAIGFYGETGSESRDETSAAGSGFLADVCRQWELETRPLAERGVRVVNARVGVVVARKSGAIEKMLLPFSLGLGGRLGSGRQYMSWIALDDVVGLLYAALFDARYVGALNCVAPRPVTNAEMTRTLARLLRRPAWLTVPPLALRIMYGQFSEEALRSQRVLPARALANGFLFRHAELESALAFELGLSPRA